MSETHSYAQLPQPNQQNKTKQFGCSGIIIGKKTTTPPPPHHHDVITFEATSRQLRKLIFGMQPYSNPTRRNMEDDLNILEMEDDLNFLKKEDDRNFFENGRGPQF